MSAFTACPTNLIAIPVVFAPLWRKHFPCNTFNRPADVIRSEVERPLLQIFNNFRLITFQGNLDCLFSGMLIPCEQRPNPSHSCLRFVPPSTKILLSGKGLARVFYTALGAASPTLPPFLGPLHPPQSFSSCSFRPRGIRFGDFPGFIVAVFAIR